MPRRDLGERYINLGVIKMSIVFKAMWLDEFTLRVRVSIEPGEYGE